MAAGLLYEPRSLWSIANVAGSGIAQRLELQRTHFYNGERWPITLKRIALCGVNYLLQGAPLDLMPIGFNETSAVISRTRVKISSPGRYHFTSKRTFVLDAAMAPKSTAQPPTQLTPGDPGEVATYLPSSLWGQCMLKPDYPLYIPRRGAIEWALSAHTPFPAEQLPPNDIPQDVTATAWMLYQQEGGLFSGSARSQQVTLFPFVGDLSQPNPQERWPYPADGYGAGVPPAGTPTSADWWSPQSRFPAGGPRGFTSQEDVRDGSSKIIGLRTFIDQRLYDQRLVAQFTNVVRPSPLSLRTGCRIRTQGIGSQTWWWRPGAPLALVFDHVTPALVMDLPEPFTLPPQGQLDVEMEIPAISQDYTSTFHVGISFNGFATIEG